MFWIQTIKNIIETQKRTLVIQEHLRKDLFEEIQRNKKTRELFTIHEDKILKIEKITDNKFYPHTFNQCAALKFLKEQQERQEKQKQHKNRKRRNGGKSSKLTKEKIYADICQSPGSTATQILNHLNLTKSPVYKHIKELIKEGRITFEMGPRPKLPSKRRHRIYYPV